MCGHHAGKAETVGFGWRFPLVVVTSFSGVYDYERFARLPYVKCVDCTRLNGTDCYCDADGAAAIREKIAAYPARGIHFIDNGNHHYMTKFWTEKISEPFTLVVFDHHSDAQKPSWASDVLSCGGWIANEIAENRFLRQVLVIGPSESSIRAVPDGIRHRIRFFGEELLDKHPSWISFAEENIGTPVYLSIDKDILSPSDVQTNWDQGHLSLAALQRHLRDISGHEKIIGADICGECSALLDIAEETAEAARNNSVNELLLAMLESGF